MDSIIILIFFQINDFYKLNNIAHLDNWKLLTDNVDFEAPYLGRSNDGDEFFWISVERFNINSNFILRIQYKRVGVNSFIRFVQSVSEHQC